MKYEQKTDHLCLIGVSDFKEAVEHTALVLNSGGVVLTPTDTVYGLICLPESTQAINTIFYMKQRPSNWRLPIIVADQEQAENELPLVWNDSANALAHAFWPGALTLAFGIRKNNIGWLAGRDEAGIRVPNYPFIQELARKLGPLLMTSANRHQTETPHTVEGALMSLTLQPALAIDGGLLSGAPSTLVNVNLPIATIERAGTIPNTEIERVLCDA